MHNTPHSSQNWGVFTASSAVTLADVMSLFVEIFGTNPAGFQPSGGTRTLNTPNIINVK
jgi:hypothetical protein